MWQQWLNLVLGLWIVASAYIGFTTSAMVTNLTITGIAIAALAAWGALSHSNYGERQRRHA